ncbi:hypothetical protein H0H93_007562 [Arthromyces matolae]|nr:hypothetical protein H0H93_007562 [Arthromyces matolae]
MFNNGHYPQTPFNVFLRSRLYSTNNLKPSLISIHTRTSSTDPKTTRYPSVEPFLSNFRLQPYVHDTLLFIRRGSYAAHFRVYFKRHKYLSKNRHIDTVRGDVLIMKVSSKNAESLVNMRSFDAMMVDAALPTSVSFSLYR